METLLKLVSFIIGGAIVLSATSSLISTIVVPRVARSRISFFSWQVVQKTFMKVVERVPRYEDKDRVLAFLGPVSLLAVLAVWIVLYLFGYALMFWALIDGSLGDALRLSGSSIFTLGIASSGQAGPTVLEFLSAATGLIVVALQIGYLPTIYSAYNRRETLVTMLESRAGTPAWGPELLARHQFSRGLNTLPALYSAWDAWAADIGESHASYPWLMAFRSPYPLRSWIIGLLAVLDAAAMHLALAPETAPSEARYLLRMGFTALRAVARVTGQAYDEDPRPDAPLQLTFEEFAFGVELVRRSGFPIERNAEEAWADFRGWRVNYESISYGLAAYFVAVPAPWSGRRLHMTEMAAAEVLAKRPRHRSPNDPEGDIIARIAVRPDVKTGEIFEPALPVGSFDSAKD